jgi:hypothetical protein
MASLLTQSLNFMYCDSLVYVRQTMYFYYDGKADLNLGKA